MIVCKIIADFDSPEGDFSSLFNDLVPNGALLCPDDAIFFASSIESFDKKKLKRILKKRGYGDSVIIEYGVSNPPKETPVVNGWIFDYLSQNAVMRLGRENQKIIRESIRQLDDIDNLIANELQKLPEVPEEGAEEGDDVNNATEEDNG